MQTSTHASHRMTPKFPPFDLSRLLETVFQPKPNEKLCILIDLDNPSDVTYFNFLKNPKNQVQKKAHDIFYQGIKNDLMQKFKLASCDLFAYQKTGGSKG